jgi:uncharacterized protein (DUF1697 family)
MTTCVLLLRAINLGSTNKVPMAGLRALLADLGATGVVTYLQSGQAVVDLSSTDPETFAGQVRDGVRELFGVDTPVLTRSADDLAAIVAANPYPALTATPKLLHVAFLERNPDPALVAAIGNRHDEDEFTVGERALYLAYSSGSQASPLSAALRKLDVVATARNWTTVTALAELAARR